MLQSASLPNTAGQHQQPSTQGSNPYQPVGDFLSNVSRFKLIESTLREGEQFANAFFDTGESWLLPGEGGCRQQGAVRS